LTLLVSTTPLFLDKLTTWWRYKEETKKIVLVSRQLENIKKYFDCKVSKRKDF